MSALSFARQAFGREKPHSSITDWVDILTSTSVEDEAYDGIPELVDSINLQAAGPAEASRALRKKLKHGNPHQQYRALVLLKALVENCGQKFQATFADSQLTDAIKNLATDPNTDKRIYKKLILVLGSWRDQFKNDPSMKLVAGLYSQCRGEGRRISQQELSHLIGIAPTAEDKKKAEKEEAKRKAKKQKEEKERRQREDEERRQRERTEGNRPTRARFDFEKDKPKVLASIADASQASSNLINAITLVNRETDSLQTNNRVQECVAKARQARKPVVRYIQLVENEEIIGALIETNERIIAAIDLYDGILRQEVDPSIAALTTGVAAARITPESESNRFLEQQPAATDRFRYGKSKDDENENNALHPDLQELNFGPLGASSNDLPPPLRPSTNSGRNDDRNAPTYDKRGSLSDFSDYDSEGEHNPQGRSLSQTKARKDYSEVFDGLDDNTVGSRTAPKTGGDPFADPFADETITGPSRK